MPPPGKREPNAPQQGPSQAFTELRTQDSELLRVVDAAFADAARRSRTHLKCRPGCTQCCVGVFPVSVLDAARLKAGLRELAAADAGRARSVRARAQQSWQRISQDFPGDRRTGLLATDRRSREAFEDFANDEVCPALDPATGLCDVYAWRPMTCRIFGPPVRSGAGLGVCELCYRRATPEQIARCEMAPDPGGLEARLDRKLQRKTGRRGETIVAFVLR